ncbi:adenosine receptor A1-like [Mytilus galloprovincialis]|uniref:Adenosine receptor A2a n=2 Tax=Mytilus galloprovincialis TaxID=29158 RepID=A0A8B6FSF2_MYTGA|nr:adenosine receptor A2a [Mytilus galloprovincialis]
MMDTTSQVYISLEVVIGAISVVGNTMVLLAIYKNMKLRTVTNTFIGSLALADLLVGILVSPLAALSYLGLPADYMWCVFTNSVIVVFTQISIFNLCAIAVERFIAIKSPYFYQEHLTIKVAIIISIIAWIAGMIVGFTPMFGWNLGPMADNKCAFLSVIDMNYIVYFNFFGFVLSPLVIMFLIYVYIYYIVRQQLVKIAALEIANQNAQKKQKLKFAKEVKAAKSLAVVIGVFALCWLPIHILNSISLICKGSNCIYPYKLLLAAILLSHINSAVNPFLYAIGNSQFQLAFKRMFCGKGAVSWQHTLTEQEITVMTRNAAMAKAKSTNSGFNSINSGPKTTENDSESSTENNLNTETQNNDNVGNGQTNPVFFV